MELSSGTTQIDVVMCVGPQDVDRLFIDSLISCLSYFPLLSHLYIVTPNKNRVLEKIKNSNIEADSQITVLSDQEVLVPSLHGEDGWYKQQIIKLNAYKIGKTRFVACLGSDTLILQPLIGDSLFSSSGTPILYYKKYERPSPHYDYEKRRLDAIEKILQVKLEKSRQFTDFILDFILWDSQVLDLLQKYLLDLYGKEAFKILSPGKCDNLDKKTAFGEQTLYAAFMLDVLRSQVEVKPFDETYFFQAHSQKDLDRFDGRSKIVHFVSKNFDLHQTRAQIRSDCKTSS